MNRHTFTFDADVKLSYEIHGQGTQNLVMLHGFGASAETWRDVQTALSKNNRLYLIDLKGFGLSSKPKDKKYSFADQADVLVRFLLMEDLRNVILVGHSYGGGVALMAYLKLRQQSQADRVSGMILIDSAGYVQPLPFFVNSLRKPILNKLILDCLPAHFRAEYTLRRIFYDSRKVTQERIERYARYFNLPGAHDAQIQSARQIVPRNAQVFVDAIATIDLPVLILWGENDHVIPTSYARRFALDLKGSRLVILPKCGHVTHEERPEESVKEISEFVMRIP
jgi:pimeloyl-ACP methyl ester carboxylesterase